MTSSKNKYHATRSAGYDSKREAQRAAQLRQQEQAGVITHLQEQVTFELIPKQMKADGRAERAVRYIADFVYNDQQGKLIVEDTKGMRTRDYIIKRKLMLYIHGITIREI